MGMNTPYETRLLQAPSSLALSTSRAGAAPASLDHLCQDLTSPTARWHPTPAAPAPPASYHQCPPVSPLIQRMSDAPAPPGPWGSKTAPACSVRPRIATTSPDAAVGPAMHRPPVLALTPLHQHNKVHWEAFSGLTKYLAIGPLH